MENSEDPSQSAYSDGPLSARQRNAMAFRWRADGGPFFFMITGLFVSILFQSFVLHCLPSVLSSLGLNASACINALMRIDESEILKRSLSLVY